MFKTGVSVAQQKDLCLLIFTISIHIHKVSKITIIHAISIAIVKLIPGANRPLPIDQLRYTLQ